MLLKAAIQVVCIQLLETRCKLALNKVSMDTSFIFGFDGGLSSLKVSNVNTWGIHVAESMIVIAGLEIEAGVIVFATLFIVIYMEIIITLHWIIL